MKGEVAGTSYDFTNCGRPSYGYTIATDNNDSALGWEAVRVISQLYQLWITTKSPNSARTITTTVEP